MQKRNDALAIEKLLQLWENTMFLEQAAALANGTQTSPVAENWPKFRDYLLRYRPGHLFDEEQFVPEAGTTTYCTGLMSAIPALVANWVAYSKRIFRVSEEMQARFSGIKFGNIRVSDLVVPFPSFAVQLEKPISDDRASYGLLLLTGFVKGSKLSPFQQWLEIVCLPTGAADYEGIPAEERESAIRMFRKPDADKLKVYRRARDLFKRYEDCAKFMPRIATTCVPTDEDMLLEDLLVKIKKDGLQATDIMQVRICFNLCLYLQSLPSGAEKEEGVQWNKEYHKKVKSEAAVITKPTQVCDITGHHILNSMIIDQRSEAGRARGGWELEPRWRRAHKRRPPGKGQDPTAEKTVKVRHYLIREDLIPEVGVLDGSLVEVR